MNRSQIKYALERIDRIEKQKLDAAENKLRAAAGKLSDEERCELVRSRKVKLRDDVTRIDKWARVADVFDFDKHETPGGVDAKALEAARKAISAESNRIRDKLVLGSAEEALSLIQAFADLEV